MLIFQEKEGIKYEYGSVQFHIVNAEVYFAFLQSMIPDYALYEKYKSVPGIDGQIPDMRDKYGRENSPHVTVLYGLDKDLSVTDIRRALDGAHLPGYVRGCGISMFDSDPRYNVVKLDIVEPEQLWRVNELLKQLPIPGETFPEYKPHMTLAYVKKDWMLTMPSLKSPLLYGYFEFSNKGASVRI